MNGSELEQESIRLLKKCIDILIKKGKEYGNANLEREGPFSGSSVCQRTGCMVDKKMIRYQNDITCARKIKEDSVVDLINNITFHYLTHNQSFEKGKQK